MTSQSKQRWVTGICVLLNCITAGSIFTFPLFAPPLARSLRLSSTQTTTLASASVLGEYVAAVGWGAMADKRGPGSISWAASVLFFLGYGLLGWRYKVSLATQQALMRAGIEYTAPSHQWIWLSFYYFLAGCATAASYFSAIIASTKSLPARHSGLAIGVPCAVFGLSPLFLSILATFFTEEKNQPVGSPNFMGTMGKDEELDPGKWLIFLAIFLAVVNAIGGMGLKVIPWVEDGDEEISEDGEESEESVAREGESSTNASQISLTEEAEQTVPSERTRLLPPNAQIPVPHVLVGIVPGELKTTPINKPNKHAPTKHQIEDQDFHSVSTLLRQPQFWLFGFVIFASIGPCEMVMASLGSIVESLLGRPTATTAAYATDKSVIMSLTRVLVTTGKGVILHDGRALGLRRLHVQVLSIANTLSRLVAGGLSDWLSYSASPPPVLESPPNGSLLPSSASFASSTVSLRPRPFFTRLSRYCQKRFRNPPKVSRLLFILISTLLLCLAFLFTAFGLSEPSGLFVLTIIVGTAYGTIFTLAPSIVRTVFPIRNFGRNWGILNWFSAGGAMVFTPLLGILMDDAAAKGKSSLSGSSHTGEGEDYRICYGTICFRSIFLWSCTSAAASSILVIVLWRVYWRGKV